MAHPMPNPAVKTIFMEDSWSKSQAEDHAASPIQLASEVGWAGRILCMEQGMMAQQVQRPPHIVPDVDLSG